MLLDSGVCFAIDFFCVSLVVFTFSFYCLHVLCCNQCFLTSRICRDVFYTHNNNNNNNNNNIHVRGTDRPRVYLDFPDPSFHAESISLHTSVLRFSQYICLYIKNV